MTLSQGIFIVFEGLDGSGTSTQARLLHEALSRDSVNASLTSEPTMGPVGNIIRLAMAHRLLISDKQEIEDRQLAYLFAADRYDHIYNNIDGIQKQLASGSIVISTRYYLSSYAYHCSNDVDFKLVERLNQDFPPADITFYVDCPINVCLRRIQQRQFMREKYEHREKLQQVHANYERIISSYKFELHRIDGQAPAHEMHNIIMKIVQHKICIKDTQASQDSRS